MKSYKVYKKIRQRASILGMPVTNFWIMVMVDALLFAFLVFGFSVLKIAVIGALAALNFIFCRYFFNVELLGNTTIKDYYRNRLD